MAAIFKNESTNSNLSTTCNELPSHHSVTGWLLALGTIRLCSSLFFLSIVIYLSLRLKKRAWDSPAKRFSNVCTLFYALTYSTYAVLNFSAQFSSSRIWNTVVSILQYPALAISLYLTVSVMTLLLQISAPLLPECLKKHSSRKIQCMKFTEVAIHVLIIVIALTWGTLNLLQQYAVITCVNLVSDDFLLTMITLCLSLSLLFMSLVILMFFFIKFLRNHTVKKSIKIIILKLGFLFVVGFFPVIFYSLSQCLLVSELTVFFIFTVFYILFLLSVLVLNYPLDTWCCKCFRKSPLHEPLLPINNTGQQTNPDSVWDHRNVPSYTATNYPNEMSDCETENIQAESCEEGEVITNDRHLCVIV